MQTQQMINLGMVVIGVIAIFFLGFVVYIFINRGLKNLLTGKYLTPPIYMVVKNTAKWLIFILVIILALQHAGIKVTNILAGVLTVAGMVAIGFIAVWSILSNVFCSLILIVSRAFEVGDEVEIVEPVGGVGLRGRVTNFNVIFTTLQEEVESGNDRMLTQIPNNIFFQKTLRRRLGKETESLGQHLLSKPLLFDEKE